MKKILFLLTFFYLISKETFSQSQWSISSPGSNINLLSSRIDTSDNSTINVGRITATGSNDDDCYIVKLSSVGAILWQRQLQHQVPNFIAPRANECFKKVIVCTNGDYVAVGNFIFNNNTRGIACRFTSAGNLLWSRVTDFTRPGTLLGQVFNDVIETSGQQIAIAGSRDWNSNVGGYSRGQVLLLNANGTEQWYGEHNNTNLQFNNDDFSSIVQVGNNLVTMGITDGNQRKNISAGAININNPFGVQNPFRTFTIAFQVPGYNNNVNSLWPYKMVVNPANNTLTVGAYACTGWGSTNGVNCVLTYNINNVTNSTFNGFYYYVPNSTNLQSLGFSQIANNDFIVGNQTMNNMGQRRTYISRFQNGSPIALYDREISNAQGAIGDIVNANGNFNFTGNTGNNGLVFNAPITLPIPENNPCNIINSPSVIQGAFAPTNINDGSNIVQIINATTTVTPTVITPNSIIANVCGTPPVDLCPKDTVHYVSKCSNVDIVLNPRSGGTSYSWSPSIGLSDPFVQNPICSATSNTTYVATITNSTTGCIYKDSFIVNVSLAPVSNLQDTSMCLGDTIQLDATVPGGISYEWTPPTNISNIYVSNPYVWPSVTTDYIVTIYNKRCTTIDTIKVTVNDCSCEDSCNWSRTGNSNVKPRNFIGSKNFADFKIRTNNIQRAVVTASGNVGINTPAPSKLLDVNGEARVATLPNALPNDKIVMANANGDLKSLSTTNNTGQYLCGNGTWQNLPVGTVNASQGVTLQAPNSVVLGDNCGKGGGGFKNDREINMQDYNLYFNSSKQGKIFMGFSENNSDECRKLYTRLEIGTRGLDAVNSYDSPTPSTSGLRFTNLTALDETIDPKYDGVLSLDEDGDVIWVRAKLAGKQELTAILDRLTKLENELKKSKEEAVILKSKLTEMDVVLGNYSIKLEQNIPNPFNDKTAIIYEVPNFITGAKLLISASNGLVIREIELKTKGKGLVNLYTKDLTAGLYTYTLIVDGKIIETKKMIKE